MKARETEYVVFDVETTGLIPKEGDRIIEIAAARVRDARIVDQFEFLINPGREIPDQAQKINHITPDMVLDAPSSAEVLPRFVEFVGGACLCGQNVKFDLDFVCYELAQAGQKIREETPAIDTIKMAKYFMPHLASFRLENLAQAFGVRVNVTHRAFADVRLTAEVFRHLLIMAEDQKMTQFSDIFREFGVVKPVYKVKQDQGMLF